jgi:diguanylate cyclase (GGDEF)-like protein
VREIDTVARVGGDEFVVLLEHVRDAEAVRGVADKMIAAVRAPATVDGQPVPLTTSIGIALHRRPESADDWMKRADASLYEAKAAGRDTARFAA